MIHSRTVFVLGAGASMPYGFPSGARLRELICEPVSDDNPLTIMLGVDPDEIKTFSRAFRHSNINSIDAFLLRRPQFSEIGKLSIAVHLCRLESADVVSSIPDAAHWYRLLWNKMVADTGNSGDVLRSQVRFISFNYDRSLERFLFSASKNTYGLSDDDALRLCKSIGIIHAYGSLGEFHHAGGERSRVYAADLTARDLRVAADGIRLIPEERAGNKQFDLGRNWFDWAERIVFLGFGFDATNCANLDLPAVLDLKRERGKAQPWIAASTMGFTDAEAELAKRLVCPNQSWNSLHRDNVMTLRELGVLN